MTPETLRARLQQFPHQPIASLPSPLEPLPRFSRQIAAGVDIWVKRDDLLGPALGGNKGRKLSYLMGEALAAGRRKVITYGGLQSNSVRMSAAAGNALGLETHIFFFARKPAHFTGNLLIDHLLGAHLHFIPYGNNDGSLTLETTNRLVRLLGTLRVGPGAYFIPNGGHSLTGCLGYVQAAAEIQEQVLAEGLAPETTTIITAAGTGGTLAGLMAGLRLINSPIQVLGIDVAKAWKDFPASVGNMAAKLCAHLGQPESFPASAVPLIEKIYVGEAYGRPSPEGLQAISQLARSEGILLDPVYTGKVVAAMLDLIKNGRFSAGETLIFLHTGGFPGIWAFEETLGRDLP